MNSLSWFLYAADALSSIKVAVLVFGSGAAIAGVLAWVAWGICRGGAADLRKWSHIEKTRIESAEAWVLVWAPYRKFLVIGFALVLLGCLLPERNTMYAIAASQVGERVIKNEQVQGIANDATKALHQWIKRQIDPEKKQ